MSNSRRHDRFIQLALVLLIAVPASLVSGLTPAPAKSPVPIDFSYAGYEAGHALPWVKAVLTVKPFGEDDTALL